MKSKHKSQFSIHFTLYKDMKINPLLLLFIVQNQCIKDYFRIMKISLFFLFVYTFQLMAVNAEAQNAIIKVPSKSLSIGQLITEIERQTDYLVVYSNHEIDVNRTVVMQKISGKVSTFLDTAFAKTDINYQFKNDYIMLSVDKADKNKLQQQAQKTTWASCPRATTWARCWPASALAG